MVKEKFGKTSRSLKYYDQDCRHNNLCALRHAHSTQKLSLIRLAMLILVLCENLLNLTCSVFGTYFKRTQIHLPVAKYLFSSQCCDNNLGSFSSYFSKLAMHAHNDDRWYPSRKLAVKGVLWW